MNDPLSDDHETTPGTLPGMEHDHKFLGSGKKTRAARPEPTVAHYAAPIPHLGVGLPAARNLSGIQFHHVVNSDGKHAVTAHDTNTAQQIGHITWGEEQTEGETHAPIGLLAVDSRHPQSHSVLPAMMDIAATHPDNKVNPSSSAERTPDSERMSKAMRRRGYVVNDRAPIAQHVYDPYKNHDDSYEPEPLHSRLVTQLLNHTDRLSAQGMSQEEVNAHPTTTSLTEALGRALRARN